jgi:hypothetical protein
MKVNLGQAGSVMVQAERTSDDVGADENVATGHQGTCANDSAVGCANADYD